MLSNLNIICFASIELCKDLLQVIREKNIFFCMLQRGGVCAEASLLPDVDFRLAEQWEESGINHIENPDVSVSCILKHNCALRI